MPRVALKDIAAKVGYSKNTVSLALRGDPQIPEHTRKKIVKVANEMGYERNAVTSKLMAQLRSTKSRQPARIALINAYSAADAFENHLTIPAYVKGVRQRARHLGYETADFWLHDPEQTPAQLLRDLKKQGIQGALLIGLMKQNRLPARYQRLWEEYPCVVTGVRTHDPALSFACVDHHHLARKAVRCALERGYQRPALVLDDMIDELVDHRFSAGFLSVEEKLAAKDRIPGFYSIDEARLDSKLFKRWFKKHQPDVLITLYNVVFDWLQEMKLKVPKDVGVIQLEWRAAEPHIAGMDQHNDVTGANAFDMLVSMIHGQEAGVPDFPRATLATGTWVDGKSVRSAPR
ncbi:MAG: hypothetical protein SynsKO_17120 [Synoicihabitans sp.]